MIIDPINTDDTPEDDQRFQCACLDDRCWGFSTDPQNIRVGKLWYAADCQNKPRAILEDQDRAFKADVIRDDFEKVRRI